MDNFDNSRVFNIWNSDKAETGKRYLVADSEIELKDAVHNWQNDEVAKTRLVSVIASIGTSSFPFRTVEGEIYSWVYLVDDYIKEVDEGTITTTITMLFDLSDDGKYMNICDDTGDNLIRVRDVSTVSAYRAVGESREYRLRINSIYDATVYLQYENEGNRDVVYNRIKEVLGFGDEQI